MTLSCSKKIIKRSSIITSKNNGDFFGLNCLHSFIINTLESHKKVRENKVFCNVIMPSKDTKTIEFIQNPKSDKATFIVHADFECIMEKIDECKNNPEHCSTKNLSKHISPGLSISRISSFRSV